MIVGGSFLRAIDPVPQHAYATERLAKAIGFIGLAVGVVMAFLAAGGRTLFAPQQEDRQ